MNPSLAKTWPGAMWDCVESRGHAWASRGHAWASRGNAWACVGMRGHAWACVGTRGHAWAFEGHPYEAKQNH